MTRLAKLWQAKLALVEAIALAQHQLITPESFYNLIIAIYMLSRSAPLAIL